MGYPKSINGVTLSDDLLIEILTRLPLKSLFRSKCVSKSWHSLISDDYVRNKLPLIVSGVLNQSNSTLKSEPKYVSTSNANFQELNLSFLPFQSNSALIDCCNGLLLFYSALTTSFHVCNPTTKRWVSLPKPSKATQLSILAFDPCHSQHFKVVNFVGWHAQGADLELFDSAPGKNYWVEREVHWGIDTDALSATMRYLGGVLYITAHPKQIVAVDLDSMDCRLIELPEPTRDECCVGKLGGWLYYSVNDGNQLRVWMLKERGEWVLKHCVSIKMGQFRVLALHPEREMVYLQGVKGKLVAYDVCEERVEEVWELGKKGYLVQVCVFPLTRYVEDCLHG